MLDDLGEWEKQVMKKIIRKPPRAPQYMRPEPPAVPAPRVDQLPEAIEIPGNSYIAVVALVCLVILGLTVFVATIG